jgi:hypothetical protein
MNEKQLAAELQASKDDGSEWGEPEPTPAPRKENRQRLAAMVSVRFAPDELEVVQRRARARGQTVSGYLRSMAVDERSDLTLYSNFGVTVSSAGTYSAEMASPRLMADGARLATSQG